MKHHSGYYLIFCSIHEAFIWRFTSHEYTSPDLQDESATWANDAEYFAGLFPQFV